VAGTLRAMSKQSSPNAADPPRPVKFALIAKK
jgi:hypothetical protein